MLYLRPALILFILLSILTGIVYPLLVAGVGGVFFPHQVAGSLLKADGQVIGSKLIGQNFTSPGYFWGRPSATSDFPYNPLNSQGSNLGPLNPELTKEVSARIQNLKKFNTNSALVPVDLVTTSASGLDPEISPAAALYQVDRIAQLRGVPEEKIRQLIEAHIQNRQFGFLGEERVNVLQLNLNLDHFYPRKVSYGRKTTKPR